MNGHVPTPSEMGWASPEQPRGVALMRALALMPIIAIVIGVSALTTNLVLGRSLLFGLGLVGLATILTCTPPFFSFTTWVMVTVPLLDLAAICTLNLAEGTGAVGPIGELAVVPAMWLGGIFRWRGVALIALTSTLGFALLGRLHEDPRTGGESDTASLIILATLAAVLMVFVVDLTIKQMVRLEEQGLRLTEAVENAETHRQHLDAIVHSVDIGLALVEPGGRYTSMNPRHREFVALAFPNGHCGVAGQTGHVYAADNATRLDREDMPSLRASRGESFSDTMLWIGEDATERLAIAASARPIYDTEGTFVGAVVAVHDVTRLVGALRVKEEFVTLVSHELRTPLTSIIGYLELSSEFRPDLPPEVTHYLGVASRNADRLLRLVSDLLTAGASTEDTGMQLVARDVDLSELVRVGLDDFAQRIDQADVVLRVGLEPHLGVVGDPSRLAQLIDNLLSNAVKYTPPGGLIAVTLTVSPDDSHLRLRVRDTGIGISTPDQQALFTKFFRATNATDRAIPGIGLGLVISKAIVEAHGGRITLESVEGQGTTLDVTLPREPAPLLVLVGHPATVSDPGP